MSRTQASVLKGGIVSRAGGNSHGRTRMRLGSTRMAAIVSRAGGNSHGRRFGCVECLGREGAGGALVENM
jgi:hypothetical protein